jgi:CelD/BcsL family acetyltransferase involved in cellulose biosynthesis
MSELTKVAEGRVGDGRAMPRPMETQVTSTRIIQGLDDLDELSDAWERLAAQASTPMLDHAWIRACAKTFTVDGQLHLLAVGTPPHMTAVAPLVRRRAVLERLELLGMNALREPLDFLFSDPSALALLANDIAQLGVPLALDRLPMDSPVVGALRSAYRRRGVVLCRPSAGWPWIPLDTSWLQPERHVNSGRRSDLRRARRIADRMGAVTAEVLSPTPKELAPLLAEAFQVEASGWKMCNGTALASDPLRQSFFHRYAAAACEKGILRLGLLRIGGRAAAMQLAVEWDKRFWLFKIGYDEEFARCSPGALLMLETLRYAAARGLRSYEFLGVVEPWLQVWTQQVRSCVMLRAYPANALGIAALVADAAKLTWRRVRRIV